MYSYDLEGMDVYHFENEMVSCELIPTLGGKIKSLFDKKKSYELLFQNPTGRYRQPDIATPFAECDASGCDDAFPNINESSDIIGGKKVDFTDHGEIWRTPMLVRRSDDSGIELVCNGTVLPYRYEKTVTLAGRGIVIHYDISNSSDYSIPLLWTLHGLINCDQSTRLLLPDSPNIAENVLSGYVLGDAGRRIPVNDRLLSLFPYGAEAMEKFYLDGRVSKGECGYLLQSAGVKLLYKYDKDKLPYLGFWCTMGGFRGDKNCALEPSTGYYDGIDTAKANGRLPTLEGGAHYSFDIRFEISDI